MPTFKELKAEIARLKRELNEARNFTMPSERGIDLGTDAWDPEKCVEACKAISQLAQQWKYVPSGNIYGVNVLAFVNRLHTDIANAKFDANTLRSRLGNVERWLDNIRQHLYDKGFLEKAITHPPEMICTAVVALLEENRRLKDRDDECNNLRTVISQIKAILNPASDDYDSTLD